MLPTAESRLTRFSRPTPLPAALFDYYGEPPVGGPEVSSTYGQYDLCGFPKAAAFWYR